MNFWISIIWKSNPMNKYFICYCVHSRIHQKVWYTRIDLPYVHNNGNQIDLKYLNALFSSSSCTLIHFTYYNLYLNMSCGLSCWLCLMHMLALLKSLDNLFSYVFETEWGLKRHKWAKIFLSNQRRKNSCFNDNEKYMLRGVYNNILTLMPIHTFKQHYW